MSESPTNARFPAGALAPARERFTAGTRFPAGRRSPTAPARRGLARRTAKLFPDEP
ncbi:hypothetical protein [Streptomyces sp. CS081A]|uniref:hypothetical protein n=1 Tax=Streptomyces sp. CS081A TaxID=2162709 RepID=UPI0013A560F2|nr:hypothetical protein [Streptomyces sp. CS081A]